MKKEIRKQVHEKCGGRCAYCGDDITVKAMQVDHIIPRKYFAERYWCSGLQEVITADYDVDDMKNLNPSCRACNNFKGVFSLESFRQELEKQVERARCYSVNFRMAEKFGLIQEEERPIVFYFEKL